jgi:4'-phosphopantetheinyl transferase EntD
VSETLAAAVEQLGHDVGVTMACVPVVGTGRQADREAGLAAARAAFASAGLPDGAIVGHEPDGRPRWPAGWTGSVAHGGGYAVSGIAPVDECRGLGVDIEQYAALPLEDAATVLDEQEKAMAATSEDPAAMATLLWSAKESAFKAWSMAIGGLDDVDPVEIHVDADVARQRLYACASGRLATIPLADLTGAYAAVESVVLTVFLHLDRPPGRPI